jgi:hypothetical protein
MEKVMHITRRLHKKLCTQLVIREKIYAQVIVQVVVHTSCTHKFARIKLVLKNYLTKFKSEVMHQNCVYKLWYSKNRNSQKEKTFQKKKVRKGRNRSLGKLTSAALSFVASRLIDLEKEEMKALQYFCSREEAMHPWAMYRALNWI